MRTHRPRLRRSSRSRRIVGQEPMKRALILAAIHPGLGGVLIRGSKGAAKSTAVRALAALLPDDRRSSRATRSAGRPARRSPAGRCPRGRAFDPPAGGAGEPARRRDRRPRRRQPEPRAGPDAPAAAPSSRACSPRPIAGILYIDEVNLLGDHLVDLLLDAAAMGVNHVEREGLTFRHPSRFVLVGTMNPEEGDLRPQLLDRFGLAVEVEPMTDPRAPRRGRPPPPGLRGRPGRLPRAAGPRPIAAKGERIAEAQRLLPVGRRPRAGPRRPLRPLRPRRGRRPPRRPDDLQGRLGPGRLRGPDDRDARRRRRRRRAGPGPPPHHATRSALRHRPRVRRRRSATDRPPTATPRSEHDPRAPDRTGRPVASRADRRRCRGPRPETTDRAPAVIAGGRARGRCRPGRPGSSRAERRPAGRRGQAHGDRSSRRLRPGGGSRRAGARPGARRDPPRRRPLAGRARPTPTAAA